ncbi:hypothetical protein [Legionella saoudiensis]|uniref:hypothetical protein n=1 Tax=Legionella saoudiensis TaxID=1750561 RepID=UPI000731BE87|nr:hypothetical protein [Legionella saoudiensis]
MALWEVYAEEAKDFDQRAKQVMIEARKVLSIYPHNFNDELLYFAVHSILRQNKIDAYTAVQDSQWKEMINEKTLFNAILDYYFSMFDEQIFRQTNWLHSNDVPTRENNILERQNFLEKLNTIRNKKFECNTTEEAIRFKLKLVTELSDLISQTDLETLKDHNTLNIVEIISSLLKLFCMSIFSSLYFDPIISNKCNMGNSFGTLWSGKSLNSIHMEHLKAKSEQLKHTCKIISEFLNIQENQRVEEVPII